MTFELVALLCTGLFTGAAIYVSLVEHPARMSLGSAAALAEFGPSYHRGAILQATLAGVGFVTGVIAWLLGAGVAWLVGAVLIGLPIPYTLLVILPINRRLLDPALDRASADASALLRAWGHHHAVRSLLGLAAFVWMALH